MSTNPKVAFYYGGNLDSSTSFSAGAVYFDTAKKQIWYDDPSKTSGSHELLTSIGEISTVTSLPASEKQKHGNIVVLKTLVTGSIYTYQIYIYDELTAKTWVPLGQNFSDTEVIYTGADSGALKKGTNLSKTLTDLQSSLLSQISAKEPTINLTINRAVVSNTSGKLTASAVTSTELGYLSGVTSNVQTQLNGKASTTHQWDIAAEYANDGVVVLTGEGGKNKVKYSAIHNSSGVAAGTYKSVTVDTKGHVTGGTNPTTLAGYGITDALTSSTKYAGSSSVGGAANSANKVNITRPSKSILEVAGDMALFSEEVYFFGSDGLLYGAPVNYVIINAKKGANHRTILDCYALQTGDHYINGCMNAQTGSTVGGANVWTGWVLQPNQASLNAKADKAEGSFYVEGSGTTDSEAKTSTWLGTSDRITSYYDGLTIRYKIGVVGQSTVTLNINNLGAKTVYRFNTTKLTTQFPVGSIINLIYHTDLNGGCWITNDYDANTNTQMRVYRQTQGYNGDYPLLVSRTKASAIATENSDNSYEGVYGVMWNDTTKVPTLNPSTGEIKAVKFTGTFSGNATSATKATKDGSNNTITSTYETKTDASAKLTEAKAYTDTIYSQIKNDLATKIEATNVQNITMYQIQINYSNYFSSGTYWARENHSFSTFDFADTASKIFQSTGTTMTIGGVSVDPTNYITGLNTSQITINIPSVTGDVVIFIEVYDYCCFIEGTQILTSLEGDTTSIEKLKPGNEVVAYNINTNNFYIAKIKQLIVHKNTTDIAEVSFDNGEKLIMNAYHPIYTDTGFHSITRHNGYDELIVGDICRTKDGWSIITDIKRYTSEPIITYNLDVIDSDEAVDNEENDTFIANGIVVHNASCPT